MKFSELPLDEELKGILDKIGWKDATPIQNLSVQGFFKKKDLIGIANTGSGKTGAFLIPIVNDMFINGCGRGSQVLILVPTRELCVQISEQFRLLGCLLKDIKVSTIFGGVDISKQALQLLQKPMVIVACPGRLYDHILVTKGLDLSTIKYLVLDEADKLLNVNFEMHLAAIIKRINSSRRNFLFSATMSDDINKLKLAINVDKNDFMLLKADKKTDIPKTLEQLFLLVPYKYKMTYLIALIKYFRNEKLIIFCNQCNVVHTINYVLKHIGYESCLLYGQLKQDQRLNAINEFKSHNKNILVCTEVGSRGLDLPNIDIVINFDIPLHNKEYIHRVGRTARKGLRGRAVSIITQYDVETFKKIELYINHQMKQFDEFNDEYALKLHSIVVNALAVVNRENPFVLINKKNKRKFKHGIDKNNMKKSYKI